MLVLSRKQDQAISFPGLGIKVKLVRVKGSSAILAIDAPKAIRIVREELLGTHNSQDESVWPGTSPLFQHRIRNELNLINVALHLLQSQLDAGLYEDADETLRKLMERADCVTTDDSVAADRDSEFDDTAKTALLVDDDANEREMLAGFLRMHSYKVATASDGQEAIDYLESNEQPSIVLMDMRMPRCDGPTTIRRIRQNPAFDETKIYGLSGSTAEEAGIKLSEEGVSGWFTKPLKPNQLVNAMATTTHD